MFFVTFSITVSCVGKTFKDLMIKSMYILICFWWDNFWTLYVFIDRTDKGSARKWGRQEMTCSKEPQGGIKPGTTAASTQPLYIADPHYPPSHHRAPSICKTLTPESCWVQFRSVRDCCAHCHKIMCLWDCYEIRTTGFVHTGTNSPSGRKKQIFCSHEHKPYR